MITDDPDIMLSILSIAIVVGMILAATWVWTRESEDPAARMRRKDREKHERQEYETNPGSFLDEEPTWEEPGFERAKQYAARLAGNPVLRERVTQLHEQAEAGTLPAVPADRFVASLGERDLFPDDDPHYDALLEVGGLAETAIRMLELGRWPEAQALMRQIVETCEGGKR